LHTLTDNRCTATTDKPTVTLVWGVKLRPIAFVNQKMV